MRPDRLEVAAVAQANWSDRPYLGWLTLFASSGTLVCCALPILLVTMGFGAVAASLNYNIPGLIFLAENKAWTLSLSALLLLLLAWVIWRPGQSCPTEPKLAAYCEKAKKWNRRIFHFSVTIWAIGFFFSYLLLPLRQFLDY
jgi:mercuric ion transport protein